MSTPENYLRAVGALNDRMWAQAGPLEAKLLALTAEHQAAARRPVTDVAARGVAALLITQINGLADKINGIYADWERNLTLIAPPNPSAGQPTFPPPKSAGGLAGKIPWPRAVPAEVRRRLTRVIEQGGIPLSKRVAIVPAKAPYGGGYGVAVEFAKW